MTNFSTAVDSGVDAGPMKSAHCQLPGREMQSENEPESPSDSFNNALVPWIGRIQASGGSCIANSRFAVHDRAVESAISDRHKRASGQNGKTPRFRWRQAGFFDLGLSLLILALSGGAVYAIEKNHAKSVAAASESVEIAADTHPRQPADKVANADADVPDSAL